MVIVQQVFGIPNEGMLNVIAATAIGFWGFVAKFAFDLPI